MQPDAGTAADRTSAHEWRFIALRLSVLGLVFFGAMTALAASMVDKMLYYPDVASRAAPANVIRIATDDGESIAAVHLPNPAARHTLWFFHGNAESLADVEPFLRELHAQGFAVFACDYPGYGVSTGRPGEKAIYAANLAAARHLREKLGTPPERVILFGRSLGGGPATELATRERFAGLVLQSTFMSVYRVVTTWPVLPFDQFQNLKKLPRVTCPVLVMHGTADEVIDFSHGRKLFAAAPAPKRHLWIEGARHNDFTDVAGERLWLALREFAAELRE